MFPDFLYGTAWKEDRTASLTELAIRMGFRAIDTANQRRHYFEAGVGQGLAAAYLTGVVTRADLFLQTKFTYQRGQDHRLPYDPAAGLAVQVAQSMASSLEHLGTDHVDSYVLHGPSSGYEWTVAGAHTEAPAFVQNRCFARVGWDRDVRSFCWERKIIYQGFSLLTANTEVVRHPLITELARGANATPAQIVFAFAHAVGMLPLTGTSDPEHLKQDLAARDLTLPADAAQAIETVAE